ncbi:MAG: tyrosine-type recombinase/integrase [Promethearchaeota archaeon]
MEEVIDPYNHKQRLNNWLKKKKIEGVSKINERLIIKFHDDMALGLNVSNKSKKGARSPIRLNTLRQRLAFLIRELEKRRIKDVRKATDKDLHQLFGDMRSGVIKTRMGTPYKSTGDYIKVFKSFWHWHQKVSKNKIEDITEDLDTRGEKPKFVYFTEEDFNKLVAKAKADLKPILSLLFDSGMRVTELMNIRVGDFSNDFKELNIRDETSKTFGRKIKLMICSEQVKKYIQFMELGSEDILCQISPPMLNRELRKLGKKILTSEQLKHKSLSLYDFRHSSCCYWLPRYKSESALKYRFGWKKSDMIIYYTEFLGMKDTITADDLYLDVTKTELEKEVGKQNKDIAILKKTIGSDRKIFLDMLDAFNKSIKQKGNPKHINKVKLMIKNQYLAS